MNTILNSFVTELFSNLFSMQTSRVKLIAYATMFTDVYFVLSYVISAKIGPLVPPTGKKFQENVDFFPSESRKVMLLRSGVARGDDSA